ncbi:glutamine synthetase family protein [Fumia xinanensis]|uniref:Glutamine synthetase n=1 Tax=Fumia xinanensis TaxID=2763659 RepID=A0A926E6J0_9FIRM|nr:glutamine synthetase family protein [Fumia xinanensis]MBC8560603.1 glutamine synthetase [Fumia xinanensis]
MGDYTMSEVLEFVEENDVKFIRLAFCDIFGRQKNVSITPSELRRAFDKGVSFDASAIDGFFSVDQSDLFLVPDPATLSVLPWRPSQGRVVRFFCDIKNPDGTSFIGDGRQILRRVVEKCSQKGLACKVGAESEFYLFLEDDKGEPTHVPFDRAGYCDIAPLDKGENVRREICLTLEEMGITAESSHHEQGPGQNEIDFRYSGALTAADDFITYQSVVRTIAGRSGLYASFMPKPIANQSGSGLHVNLSLYKNGRNVFQDLLRGVPSEAEGFIAGILNRVSECTAFLNPLTNSYERLGKCKAPRYITWSKGNRSQLIRIPLASYDSERCRMELRSPDGACNPYYAFALLIAAGLEGIEKEMKLPKPTELNLMDASVDTTGLQSLPKTLGEAVGAARRSEFLKEVLPTDVIEKFLAAKQREWEEVNGSPDSHEAENQLYFGQI